MFSGVFSRRPMQTFLQTVIKDVNIHTEHAVRSLTPRPVYIIKKVGKFTWSYMFRKKKKNDHIIHVSRNRVCFFIIPANVLFAGVWFLSASGVLLSFKPIKLAWLQTLYLLIVC